MSVYTVQPDGKGYSEVHEFNRQAPLHVVYVGCSGCGELLCGQLAVFELAEQKGLLHRGCGMDLLLLEGGNITHTNVVEGQTLDVLLPVATTRALGE